jgi:homoserine kinase
MQRTTEVFAPASVGNAGIGFDIMGFALSAPGDVVVVRPGNRPGLRIVRITGDGGSLSLDPARNTAGLAALRLLEHVGACGLGIEMELHKRMPIGSGLGSSAASAVAGAFGINEYLGRPLEKRALLPFALEGEYLASGGMHADNVAPCLLGGFLLVRDHTTLDLHKLPVPAGLHATVMYPHVKVLTREAREILRPEVPMASFVRQTANLGAFIIGMYESDISLLSRSLEDNVIEPQRAGLIPHFHALKAAAMGAGALGCSISGSGPSVFALSAGPTIAGEVAEAMRRVMHDHGVPFDCFISTVNEEGAAPYSS